MSSGLKTITTLYSPPSLPGAKFLLSKGGKGEIGVGTVIGADPPRNKADREDALEVLELCLMTNARDVPQMLLCDLSVDRLVGDETCHFGTVTALIPDIADLDQGTVVIDNPSQLIPRLHCRIIQVSNIKANSQWTVAMF